MLSSYCKLIIARVFLFHSTIYKTTQAHNGDIRHINKGCFSVLIKVAKIELAGRDVAEREKLRYYSRRRAHIKN